MVRATSTVLDAALFLLLVGGAVMTLSLSGTGAEPTPPAHHTTEALTASTADVHYSLAPGAQQATNQSRFEPGTEGPAFRRVAHGTLASHLADAALGNLTVDDTEVTHTHDAYERQVTNATRNLTRTRDQLTQVRAVWHPYRGAPIGGTVTAGPSPPPDERVHATTLTVDSGLPEVRGQARDAAANGSHENVSRVVAEGVVSGLFPERTARGALTGDYPVNALVRYRYERMAMLLGADVGSPLAQRNVTAANERLADALAERLAEDLQGRFDSPRAAARAVSVGEVRIVVRTWSP